MPTSSKAAIKITIPLAGDLLETAIPPLPFADEGLYILESVIKSDSELLLFKDFSDLVDCLLRKTTAVLLPVWKHIMVEQALQYR